MSNDNHVIVSHVGPITPGKKNFELCSNLLKRLDLSICNCKLGKVFIPSFMSEWLYLYFVFDNSIRDVKLDLSILPTNLSVVDSCNIKNFFYFPKYYECDI